MSDFPLSQQLPPLIGSLSSLRKARIWLKTCAQSNRIHHQDPEDLSYSSDAQNVGIWYHSTCKFYSTPGYVPTRLLEPEKFRCRQVEDVFIIEGKPG